MLSVSVVEMGSVGWLSAAVVDDDGGGGRDDGSRMARHGTSQPHMKHHVI